MRAKFDETSFLKKLRAICLALPEASECETFGHPAFRAGKKTFAVFEEYRGIKSLALSVGIDTQEILVRDPRFYVTPYSGKYGWVSLDVGRGVDDWNEIRDLVLRSYRRMALKRMIAALPVNAKP